MAHSHHHAHIAHYPGCTQPSTCRCETRRYLKVLGISALILAFEIIGGIYSGSLALLADAAHVFTDMSAIFISVIVAEAARAQFSAEKARDVGFWINVTLLGLVAFGILYEAVERWNNPREVTSWIMLSVAIIGGFGNWVQHKTLGDHSHNKTSRALNFHILADLATSVGVVLAGIVIWVTAWYWVDAAVSFVIALWIGFQVITLIRDPEGGGHHHH